MNLLKTGVLCGAALLALSASAARADVLTLGGGWDTFYYGYADPADPTPLGDINLNPVEFDFTLTGAGFLKITDAYFTGDQYQLTINNVLQAPTSAPTLAADFTPSYDVAFHDPNFSSGAYYLTAGTYVVTGVALNSPYGIGAGGIELASNVPEPGAWALTLAGFGGLGAVARRRRSRAARA